MKYSHLACFVLSLFLSGQSLAASENEGCGKVTVADMNWNSATLIAHVDQFVLEHAFNCDAELVPGDTMPTGTSMIEKGEPDIAPEFWSNSMKDALEKGISEKRLLVAGKTLSEGGNEGFWVPEYLVKKYPELSTIEGVKKHAKLFTHPEYSNKSAFYNCPAGWNCQISAGNLFAALKLEEAGFDLVDPGSGAAFFWFYCQEPMSESNSRGSATIGRLQRFSASTTWSKIDFGVDAVCNKDEFLNCTTKEDCFWTPKVTMYPSSSVVNTITTESFCGSLTAPPWLMTMSASVPVTNKPR